jgi:hypothetical protein
MVNEATLVWETALPIPMTCSNSTGIEKGAILSLADPFTVALSAATNDIAGGILSEEKIASNGITKVGVYRKGIFKVKASGNITVGDSVGTCLDNYTVSNRATTTLSGAKTLGIALETATDEETYLMELTCSTMNSTT